ncbi:MAG: ABC transporter permease [Fimbriimonadaceae bacterium]|nr:ABC transporter permease [Fimbriimonadaceae bacterium]
MTGPVAAGGLTALAGQLGSAVLGLLTVLGEWILLWLATTSLVLRGRIARRHLVHQLEAIFLGSLPLACLTVVFSSMVLALYTADQFIEYGFTDYIGKLIATGVARELGPVLTAIVVASREGSAIAAELGTMKVTEQVDALRALATDPVEYLIVPRYTATLIAMPLLTIAAGTAGVCGGYLVAGSKGIPQEVYWLSAARGVEMIDFTSGLAKALVFGALIAVVSCWQGLRTGHGSAAVGRSTTASVVLCVVLVHIADFLMVSVLN